MVGQAPGSFQAVQGEYSKMRPIDQVNQNGAASDKRRQFESFMQNMDDDDEEDFEIEGKPNGQLVAARAKSVLLEDEAMQDEGDDSEVQHHINQLKRQLHTGEAIRNDNAPHIPADSLMQEQVNLLQRFVSSLRGFMPNATHNLHE